MITGKLKLFLLVFLNVILGMGLSHAQSKKGEQHILVSMRMIGHQVLLNSGDSTSRVLPVEKIAGSYKIQFGSAFMFSPEELASTIDRVISQTKIASSYIVEVKSCERDLVVYSYEKGDSMSPDLMTCGPRLQPKACYVLFITLLQRQDLAVLYHTTTISTTSTETTEESFHDASIRPRSVRNSEKSVPVKKQPSYSMMALPIGSVFLFLGLFVFFRKRRPVSDPPDELSHSADIVLIGNSLFDKKNMTLSFKNEKTELSSKESDLLSLLQANENKTLEREYILKVVWGDEGDYIGRTLDVFISKLRKKLEADSSVRIVNIRGIGYKFIVN